MTQNSSSISTVPLTKVTLYKHGIGYFERRGAVSAPNSVELQCGPDEIDDMLKSLLVLNQGGGRVSAVTYESSKPLEERLNEFGFDLRNSLNMADLLGQLKGTPVKVKAKGKSHSGRVIGLDTTEKTVGQTVFVERFLLILTNDNVLHRLDISEIEGMEVIDEAMAKELQQQLELLFLSVKKKDRKLLKIDITGDDKQDLIVAYSIPCPIWKTSYRLVFDKDERLLLQGVAIVDNVQEEDWNDVEMVLVSASPISFIQPLYEPIKPVRRTIEGQGVQSTGPFVIERAQKMKAAGRAGAAGGAYDALETQSQPVLAMAMAPPGAAPAMFAQQAASSSWGNEGSWSSAGLSTLAEQKLDLETVERGENFEYRIGGTVSIPRNSSALIPVVQQFVEGERLSLYQESRHPDFPYATVKLKNTTGLTLEAGPVTVMEDESYAGEALIDVVKPDDIRFLPYALDQSVRVVVRSDYQRKPVWRAQIQDGVLYLYHKEVSRKSYNIENLGQKRKIVYVEHPVKEDWKLICKESNGADLESSDKPEDTTKNFYRFRIELDGKEDYKLVVNEEKAVTTQFYLSSDSHLSENQMRWLFEQNYANKKFLEFLKQVQAIRSELFNLQTVINSYYELVAQHETEQKRARENVKTLGAGADRFRQAIEEAEDKIVETQKQIQELKVHVREKTEELNELLRVRMGSDIVEVPVDA